MDGVRFSLKGMAIFSMAMLLMSCQTRGPALPEAAGDGPALRMVGNLEHKKLKEVSGIAPSRIHPDRLWVLNDGGNAPHLYAIGLDGSHRGRFTIGGAENRDWEDLASYREEGRSWLVVGEMGDNDAKHKICRLLFVEEPRERDLEIPEVINPARVIEFQYEGGPRDVEGLSVDPKAGKIYLLSKRTKPPVLYQLPLRSGEGRVEVATRVSDVLGIHPPSMAVMLAAPQKAKYASSPTAMDRHVSTGWNVVMTYRDLYFYSDQSLRNGQEPEGFKPLPYLAQGEAVCFSEDGSSIYFTSEKHPAPLYQLRLPSGFAQPTNDPSHSKESK